LNICLNKRVDSKFSKNRRVDILVDGGKYVSQVSWHGNIDKSIERANIPEVDEFHEKE
jgi:hypothetical protein